jgi:2-hydroxychromene-2-carboxylate isomerase
MSKQIEFYFDMGSPTAYLAYKRLGQLAAQYPLTVVLRPMLLGGVFKATGNTSPVTIPAKGRYMLEHDLPRFARRYGVTLNFNPHFPINTLPLMRGALAAGALGCQEAYVSAVFDAIWVAGDNLGDPAVIAESLQSAGLDAGALMTKAQEPAIKAALVSATEAAVERGVFGAPTFFMDGDMYFGQDRLDFVEEALRT